MDHRFVSQRIESSGLFGENFLIKSFSGTAEIYRRSLANTWFTKIKLVAVDLHPNLTQCLLQGQCADRAKGARSLQFFGGGLNPVEFGMPLQTVPFPSAAGTPQAKDIFQDTMSLRSFQGYSGVLTANVSRDSDSGCMDFAARISGYFLPLDSPSISP